MNILIVDDEEYLREELKDTLERVSPGNEYSFAERYNSAITLAQKNHFDIAFLDIQLPEKNGLLLAERIKEISPKTNIVMVTAYSEYALDALKLFVSGYILKPVTDNEVKEVIDNLRTPLENDKNIDIEARCFGNFELFIENKPMLFKRTKEKEILAYLICLNGATANKNEICAALFGESIPLEKVNASFKNIVSSLRKDLHRYKIDELLIHNKNSYSINTSMIKCDYYDFIKGKSDKSRSYKGEFMNQYSWAETYIYSLENY